MPLEKKSARISLLNAYYWFMRARKQKVHFVEWWEKRMLHSLFFTYARCLAWFVGCFFLHSFIQFQLFGTFFVCGKIFSWVQLRDLFCYSFLALTYTIVHRTHICNENTFTIMISARFSPIHDIAIKAYAVHNTRVRVHSYSSLGESNLTEKSTLPNTKTHSR